VFAHLPSNITLEEKTMKTTRFLASICVLFLVSISYIIPQGAATPRHKLVVPERIKKQVERISGSAGLVVARNLGLTELRGKTFAFAAGTGGGVRSQIFNDIPISASQTADENEPTLAINPMNRRSVVAGCHYFDDANGIYRCAAYYSSNGGKNWNGPIFMPQLTPESMPSDPVLAFAPNGSRVYFAYMDIKEYLDFTNYPLVALTDDWDIVVSYSDNGGATWTGPIIALDGNPAAALINWETGEIVSLLDPGFVYDKCWIGTHVGGTGNKWVYVTATRFDEFTSNDQIHIAFARSNNKALSWSQPTLLETAAPIAVDQGSRPIGGKGDGVLVAWYNSGTDGWLEGGLEIRTKYSPDHGLTWNPVVIAAADEFEAPYYLGPFSMYHRWWGTMFPDVEIDQSGTAHIVYGHDPEGQSFDSATAEDGDIRYITSPASPYNSWSSPVTINDDGLVRAQGYAALKAGTVIGHTILHVIWNDHRLSPEVVPPPESFFDLPNSSNLYYDVYYSAKIPDSSPAWTSNVRVTDASSISDVNFIGDYNDIVDYPGAAFGVWTDRRHQTGTGATVVDGSIVLDYAAMEDNVFGSVVLGNISLPKEPSVVEQSTQPKSFVLSQNFPNPFNPETTIHFALPQPEKVEITIYNTLGQQVRQLVSAEYPAGEHAIKWDGLDDLGYGVSGGLYLYRMRAGEFATTQKMLLQK